MPIMTGHDLPSNHSEPLSAEEKHIESPVASDEQQEGAINTVASQYATSSTTMGSPGAGYERGGRHI